MSEMIFVFGSNRQGRHGKGAALVARNGFNAVYGQAEGPQGNAYAIVTKELRDDWPPVSLDEIRSGVNRFIEYANRNPDKSFMVSPLGCGLAGFSPEQIAPMFQGAPRNVMLPVCFLEVIAPMVCETTVEEIHWQ